MADAAGLNFDPNLARTRLGNFAFDDFKRPAGAGDLDSTHFRHKNLFED